FRGFSSGKATGDGRRPEDQILFLPAVVKNFRRPTIHRRRLIGPHRKGLLLRPPYQVFRVRDADLTPAPARCPNHVENPVRPLNDAGVAHQLLAADRRSQIRLVFIQRLPFQPVATVGQMQPVLAVVFEIGEQIVRVMRRRLLRRDRGRKQRQDENESGKMFGVHEETPTENLPRRKSTHHQKSSDDVSGVRRYGTGSVSDLSIDTRPIDQGSGRLRSPYRTALPRCALLYGRKTFDWYQRDGPDQSHIG